MDETEKTRAALRTSSSERDHLVVFEELKKAAEFRGQWQEAQLISDPKDVRIPTALIAAGRELLMSGRQEQALFAAEEARKCMKRLIIDANNIRFAVVENANLSTLLFDLGEPSASEHLALSVTQLERILKRYRGKGYDSTSELISKNYSILVPLIQPIIIAENKKGTGIPENWWLQLLLGARLTVSCLMEIVVEFSQSAPLLVDPLVQKIQSHSIDEPKKTIDGIQAYLSSNENRDAFERGLNRMVLFGEDLTSAEFLFRLTLMSGTSTNILQHLPIFVQLGNPIAEYLTLMGSAPTFYQHESQKTRAPLLEYFVEQNELSLFVKYCGSDALSNPNSPFSQKAVAAFIQKYGSGTAAIQELSGRRSMMNEAVINNLVIAIIFHCHDDTTELADSIHKSASSFSIDEQIVLYAKTHDDETWQQLENQLLQFTNSPYFRLTVTTMVNQCNAYANCHLLEKVASSIAKKLHGSQKNRAIKQLIDKCYEVLNTSDLAGFEALVNAIDQNCTCFFEGSSIPIQFMMSTEDSVINGQTRHFTTTQRALLRHIFPTIIAELRRDPQRIGSSTIMYVALTYAQADEEASSKVLLSLHAQTCAAQKVERSQEERLKDTAIIIDIFCRQKKFGQAVSVFTQWVPLSELHSLLTRGNYRLTTAVKYLIAQLGKNKATTELVNLYNVFDHPLKILLATDFLRAGLSINLLRPSLKVLENKRHITLLADIYRNFDGLDNPDNIAQLANEICSEFFCFPPPLLRYKHESALNTAHYITTSSLN